MPESAALDLETLGRDLRAEFGDALSRGVELRALMLASEVGELAKEVIRGSAYGTHAFQPGAHFREELGDTLVDLVLLAEEAGVSLTECLALSVSKMRDRLRERGHVASEHTQDTA